MKDRELIKKAKSVTKHRKIGDNSYGDVGSALISKKGKVYTGVCIDTMSSMGYCAEHNAIGSMLTDGETKIEKIVAVWKDKKGKSFILHPCGRCREFMRQINEKNMSTEVILGKDKVVKLKALLPYKDDYSKV